MSNKKEGVLEKCHKTMAPTCFNLTWEYIEKKDRSAEDDAMMIHAAHASRFHWGKIGKPLHFQRGEWQVSRVYAILGRAEPALYHAKTCLEWTENERLVDFDLAFAFECMARAHAVSNNKKEFEKFAKLARDAGEKIEKKEDKDYFFKDFDDGEWFGFK